MIKISIIIPCYNLGEYIKPCLESIKQQKIGEVEYIFVNDGSTDDTLRNIQDFCEGKHYCKVLDQSNAGVSAARNSALMIAAGEYVYLLDGDDILTENAVEKMLTAVEKSDCDAVLSDGIILKNNKEKSLPLPLSDGIYTPVELYKAVKVFPTIPQLLYKRDILEKQNLRFDTNLKYGEVYDFTIRFFCFSTRIKIVSQSYFKYVMRKESASHTPNYQKDLSVIETLKKYNKVGIQFSSFSSFNTTTFKMIMAFTYNKYVKLKLTNEDALRNIKKLLKDPEVKALIKKIANSSSSIKERILAMYVLKTGVNGYRLLTHII